MKRTKTFDVEYNYFDPGTFVEPTSSRSSLPDGRYKVTECVEPRFPEDHCVVFIEGRDTAVRTEYLREVQ